MFAFLKRLFGKHDHTAAQPQQTPQEPLQEAAPVEEPEIFMPLKLRGMGRGERVRYSSGGSYSGTCLWWVSEETDGDGQPVYIRESREKTVMLPSGLPFTAGGKLYLSLKQLSPNDVIDGVDSDVHGRQVLCYRERFPCFDSYDYLHEHRYYRWFFLKEHGRLTRVYVADESGWIHITEDAENVEDKCAELLKQHGWIE